MNTKQPKLLAFHGDPAIKIKYLNRVLAHHKADEIIQNYGYWNAGKGCGVGCTIHSGNHKLYQTELGIPQELAYLEDSLFEALPSELAKLWPSQFLDAIKPGADLSTVYAKFVVWQGVDEKEGIILLAESDGERDSVREVSALYRRLVDGGTVTQQEWIDAENRVGAGAWARAGAGAWAGALYYKRIERQADKLLELLREAE